MEFIADFHIHSKYSRATSRDMNLDHLADWARIKGIKLLGTGDFSHHLWLEELKSKLEPLDNGLFIYKDIYFILTGEISSIYSKNNRTYRIHNLVFSPSFKIVDKIDSILSGYGNIASDGRPILGLDAKEVARIMFDVSSDNFIVPAHAWTPWFSVFGSMSGFNCVEECFEELTPKIYCLETGLSSDPAMNWRLSKLDKYTLISNSDAHSPSKIGREANVFNCNLDYKEILDVLKSKDKKRFLYTIEFFPEEGKYHFDGHRLCGISFSPQETRQHKNKCPKCGKPLTVGVMNRVEQLADRPAGFVPENSIPFKNLIPLEEVIADSKGVRKESAAVEKEYHTIVSKFNNEFEILLKASKEELLKKIPQKIAEGILLVRQGKVKLEPGFDGEYGKIKIFAGQQEEKKEDSQLSLF